MHEKIQVNSGLDNYKKGERKALDEQTLKTLWGFDETTQHYLLNEISVQLRRLATVSATYIAPPDKQISLVLDAFEKSDSQAAMTHQTHTPSLCKYRRNVIAALAFVVTTQFPNLVIKFTLPENTINTFKTLESLEERSQAIKRKLSDPEIAKGLTEFPHIKELLEFYAKHNDITPLLDTNGILYSKESRPNDYMKAFLFGKRRPGSDRQFEGIAGVEAWARKLLFARYCKNQTNIWGVDMSGHISQTAAYITSHPIPKGHKFYTNYYHARRFFEKILEVEFREFTGNETPEFYEFFPIKTTQRISGKFEDIDVSATYKKFAQHHTEPEAIRDVLKRIVSGERYPQIASVFQQSQFYNIETLKSWLRFGTLVIERCLLSNEIYGGDSFKLVSSDREEKLGAIKNRLTAIT